MSKIVVLIKAKFIKKYRGPSGKWVYIYRTPSGRTVKREASEVRHSLATLTRMFSKRPPGQGMPMAISSKADLDIVLTQTTFAMISAGRNPNRPSDSKLTNHDIKRRFTKLKSDLVAKGYIFTPAKGKYGGEEESLFVMCHDANRGEIMNLGTMYRQDSVLFVDHGKGELIGTSGAVKGKTMMAGEGHDITPDADDFYTEVDIAGEPVKFCMRLSDIAKAIQNLFYRLVK